MPNDHFRFKQFTVRQDRCAMKVTIDACIFGAWVPLQDGVMRLLDVGAGTGLLSLMLAQRFPHLYIDALELVSEAAGQARENVALSPFAERIRVHHEDARLFNPSERYDALICNPPFFSKSLTNPHHHRAIARHDGHLTFEDLPQIFDRTLKPDGVAYIILPAARFTDWTDCCQALGWNTAHTCFLKSHQGDEKGRAFVVMQKVVSGQSTSSLITNDSPGGELSAEVKTLLGPFHLKL